MVKIKNLIHVTYKGTLYFMCFLLTALIVSCNTHEKKAKRIVESASDLNIETLYRLDSLISIYGNSTHCLSVVAPRSFFGFSDEELDDSVKMAYDMLQPFYDDYKKNHYDTLPREELRIKTLFWLNNGTPFNAPTHGSQSYWKKQGLYKYEDGELSQLLIAHPEFKFIFLKDWEELKNFFDKNGYFGQGCLDAIKEINKAQYITFVEKICEMKPCAEIGFFSSGGILSNVKVFDIKSGNLIKSMSVYAANSDSLSYTSSKHENTFEIEDDVTMQNLLNNEWTMMVRQLNTICP